MRWDDSPAGGFTTGEPWLPLVGPYEVNVEAQRADPRSMLALVRELIRLRRTLPDDFELLEASAGVVAFARGDHLIALNTTARPLPVPRGRDPVIETVDGALSGNELAAHAAAVTKV
jgi:alpha-glucosidase